MLNREEVIDHLYIIRTWNEVGKAYAYDEMDKKEKAKTVEWIDDVLELLKEQEPVEPKIQTSHDGNGTWWYVCGMCNTAINPNDKFCHECGKKVKLG